MFVSINPWTEEKIGETPSLSLKQLEQKLSLAEQSWPSWRALPIDNKISIIQNLGEVLLQKKKELATCITQEMGKPLSQSQAEVVKSAKLCAYIAHQAPTALADQKDIPFGPKGAYITFQAMGVILGIMPWNFPVWQALRFALPALVSGNVVLLKPAPCVMLSALKLEELFLSAGFPLGVCQGVAYIYRTNKKSDSRSPNTRGVFNWFC